MNQFLQLHRDDNVAIALIPLSPGTSLSLSDRTIALAREIPVMHKVALARIAKGQEIIKYGQPIGTATVDIEPGDHVRASR